MWCWKLREVGTDEAFWNDANTKTFHYSDVTKMQLLLSHSHWGRRLKKPKVFLQSMCNWAKLIQSWGTQPLNFVLASAVTDVTILYWHVFVKPCGLYASKHVPRLTFQWESLGHTVNTLRQRQMHLLMMCRNSIPQTSHLCQIKCREGAK